MGTLLKGTHTVTPNSLGASRGGTTTVPPSSITPTPVSGARHELETCWPSERPSTGTEGVPHEPPLQPRRPCDAHPVGDFHRYGVPRTGI